MSAKEKIRARKAAKKAAKEAAEAEEAAKKAAEEEENKRAAKKLLETHRRARAKLALEGYWRPCTLFKSDARYAEDFEVIVSCPLELVVRDEGACWDDEAQCFTEDPDQPVWWVGATLFDHEGNKCYTYQRLEKRPRPPEVPARSGGARPAPAPGSEGTGGISKGPRASQTRTQSPPS